MRVRCARNKMLPEHATAGPWCAFLAPDRTPPRGPLGGGDRPAAARSRGSRSRVLRRAPCRAGRHPAASRRAAPRTTSRAGRCSGPPSSLVAHGDDRLGAGGATGGAGPEADGGYDVDRCRTPAAAAAAAATLSYARFAPFRSFLTALAAAILVVPVAFAQQPANASLTVRLIGRNPSAVRLKIARAVAPTTRLAVTANGCTL